MDKRYNEIKRKVNERLNIEYKKKAVKYINSSDKNTKQRLKKAIENIPFGDIKKLSGFENEYRLRVGDLRVLFTLENDTVIVNEIGSRGEIYKRL